MLPELDTGRLKVRLARPGMEAPLARFLCENYPGHLDRWSPPPVQGFFTATFWRERLDIAIEELQADHAVRFVLQARVPDEEGGTPIDAPIIGTCNYTNIVRGAFHACHLGYQIARESQGLGLMAEALRAANGFMFDAMRMHRLMANFRPENTRSRALLNQLGFVEEGLARNYLFIDGAWRDHILTSLMHPHFNDSWILASR
ncbi:MAG: GNAT family N-acetyltransferase [Usitatibacter sp.]